MSADYKQKYLEMRDKLIDSTDAAYRLGYAEGLEKGEQQAQQAQMQAQMEAQAQMETQAQMQAMAQGGMPPGAEGEMPQEEMPPGAEGEMPPEMMESGEEMPPEEMAGEQSASDLDSSIAELEAMVAKGEKPSVRQMRDKIESLSELRKSQKVAWKNKVKQTTNSQKEFVNSLISKWDSSAKDTSLDIEKVMKESGIEVQD